jgi:hypothetical protein
MLLFMLDVVFVMEVVDFESAGPKTICATVHTMTAFAGEKLPVT